MSKKETLARAELVELLRDNGMQSDCAPENQAAALTAAGYHKACEVNQAAATKWAARALYADSGHEVPWEEAPADLRARYGQTARFVLYAALPFLGQGGKA